MGLVFRTRSSRYGVLLAVNRFSFCARCYGQGTSFGNALQALNEALRRLEFPVVTFQRPHGYASQTDTTDGAPKLRPTIAEGRPHQHGRRIAFEAQGAKNAVLTSAEFVDDSPSW